MPMEEKRPKEIPSYAKNVRQDGEWWIWEISGGAVVFIGRLVYGQLQFRCYEGEIFRLLIKQIMADGPRHLKAVNDELARQASYKSYLAGVDYEPDES
jgi:hypothetical protein